MTSTAQPPAPPPATSRSQPSAEEGRTANGPTHEAPDTEQTHPPGIHPSGVQATARIRAGHNGRTTTLPLLHGDGPFHLHRLQTLDGQAHVCVIGAMSAPLGGDRLTLDITAEAHAQLEVTTAAATIALRGATTAPATYDVRLTAADHATLHWLPEPLISTRGSTLHQTYTVDLAPTAQLLLREEQLLGRTAEPPGHLTTHLTVHRDGRVLLDQHTAYGNPAPAWDGPAVLGSHRAAGQLLIVHPQLATDHQPILIGDDPQEGYAVLTPLANQPALLATAVAPTAARLRHLLDTALEHVPDVQA